MSQESITIGHIVAKENESLKIRQVEQPIGLKTHLDFIQVIAAANAKKRYAVWDSLVCPRISVIDWVFR